MLIRFSGPAAAFDANDEPVIAPEILQQLDGAAYEDEAFTDFLGGPTQETDVALLLEFGGHLMFRFDTTQNRLTVCTEYRAARRLDDAELKTLTKYTLGQWSDGIGENFAGESFDRYGYSIQCEADEVEVAQIDDGIPSSGNGAAELYAAINAGDLDAAIAAIPRCANINARLAGCTPLLWAIIYDHPDIAIALSEHSDLEAVNPMGSSALHCVATSRLTELDSVRVANALIKAGAAVDREDYMSNTPAALAELRNKHQLYAVLVER